MSVADVENRRKLFGPEYCLVSAVNLRASGEYVFARDPNPPKSVFPNGTGIDMVLGRRPTLETEIRMGLMETPGIRSLVVIPAPTRGGFKFDLIDGWDGKVEIIVSKKRIYRVFLGGYSVDEKTIRNFEISEIENISLQDNIQCTGGEKGLVRLHLSGAVLAPRVINGKKILAQDVWSGSIETEGDLSGDLIVQALNSINKTIAAERYPLWKQR